MLISTSHHIFEEHSSTTQMKKKKKKVLRNLLTVCRCPVGKGNHTYKHMHTLLISWSAHTASYMWPWENIPRLMTVTSGGMTPFSSSHLFSGALFNMRGYSSFLYSRRAWLIYIWLWSVSDLENGCIASDISGCSLLCLIWVAVSGEVPKAARGERVNTRLRC